ncbi:transglycosylase SLT domain-containing protein, partial [Kaarinaea lacus]
MLRPVLIITSLLGLSACAALSPGVAPLSETTLVHTSDMVIADNETTGNVTSDITTSSMPETNEVTSADSEQLVETEAMSEDLWQRVRDGFSMEDSDHERVQRQLDWYQRHPAYMQRVAERATPYFFYVIETIEENEIPAELALLPIVESAFQPFAYSHGRAAGIWQFIPSTGRLYGLKQNWWYDGRRDVYAATQAAIKLLKNLNEQFDGDW